MCVAPVPHISGATDLSSNSDKPSNGTVVALASRPAASRPDRYWASLEVGREAHSSVFRRCTDLLDCLFGPAPGTASAADAAIRGPDAKSRHCNGMRRLRQGA